MAGKIRLADLGATRRIRGRFSKGHQPAGWRVARPLTATKPSENLTRNPDVVQPAIRRVDVFVTLLPRVCRSLRSLLNSRLTTFNPRRARVVPILSDNNKYQPHWLVIPIIFFIPSGPLPFSKPRKAMRFLLIPGTTRGSAELPPTGLSHFSRNEISRTPRNNRV